MTTKIYSIKDYKMYCKAGPTDLIELIPKPGNHPLFILKWILETTVYAIVNGEFIHLSGGTGTAKSSLIETLYEVPENMQMIAKALKLEDKPLRMYTIEMALYETPGDLIQRRSLKDGATYDEYSELVKALQDAQQYKKDHYTLIFLREIGRVHASSVQGGLLNLMTKNDIYLNDGQRISGSGIAWIADSNYQAADDNTHTLVTFDDALRRRFSINITLDYLPEPEEQMVLERIVKHNTQLKMDIKLISNIVKLGNLIRMRRAEGDLQSVVPPTIYGYLSLFKMAQYMPHMDFKQHVMSSMLGNASHEDLKDAMLLLNQALGFRGMEEEDSVINDVLF